MHACRSTLEDPTVELYQRRVELTDPEDVDLRYELLVAAATCHETQFHDRLQAIDFLVQALDAKPADPSVLERLGVLYRAENQWPELLDNLRAQAGIAQTPETRAGFYRDMGDLLATKLENFDEALSAYQSVLEEIPSDPKTRTAVRGIGRDHEELREQVASILLPALQGARLFEDVVEVLDLRLSVESDPLARSQTLRAMARVLEVELHDPARAHAALLRAMAEVPEDASIHAEVERLSEQSDQETRWGAYADALTERAQNTFEADLAKELYSRLGQIAENQLKDPGRAIDAYTKAVDQVGDQPEILQSLDRLYVSSKKWSELIDILDRLAPLVQSDAERAELHYRSAVVQIDHFSESGQGLAQLRTALELDSRHEGASKKLEALTERRDLFEEAAEVLESVYRARGALDQLALLSERRVEFAETPGERIEMRKSLARVLEDEMGNTQAAQRVLQQGLKDDPSDVELLDRIERLASLTGDWAAAGSALLDAVNHNDTLAAVDGKELCLRLAGWFSDHTGDVGAAEKALEKAFQYDETADDVLLRLEALQSSPGKELSRVETLRKRARLQFDEHEREMLVRKAYELAVSRNATALAEEVARELLSHDDANRWALTELVELRERAQDYEETYTLLLRLAEVSLDAATLSTLRHRAAAMARDHLGEKPKAIELFEQLVEDDPLDAAAASALRALYGELQRYEELAQLLARLIDVSEVSGERSALRIELARMQLERFKSTSKAAELLNTVLEEEPGNSEAVVLLSHLYEAEGRDRELADLLDAQIAAARERGDRDAELRFEVRLGQIYDSKLGDPARAIDTYQRVLQQDPKHLEALHALVRLYKAAGQLVQAADILATMVELCEGKARLDLLKDLSKTYVALKEPEKAIQCLEIALEQDHTDAEVRSSLRALYRDHAAWERLGELLGADAGHLKDPVQQLATLREAATVFSERAKNHIRAAQILEKAVELKPDDRGILMLLCDEYNASGRGKDAVAVLEKVVESYAGRRSKELADVHRRLAAAYQSDGNLPRAVEELEKAFRIEPGNVTVLTDLGLLSLQAGDLARAQQMFRALLLQKLGDDSPISKAQVFYYLGLVHHRLNEKPRAVQMLERALQADKDMADAEKLLTELRG